ncbi:hypothetical protein [Sinorhizobium sp. BG8]|uniref:hypothetical protein n=1 Tax=Sinorhizobium sp. BG8 TaxID=2613773 RepID=UPI00193E7AAF|nr:hypothetical protein [Sinorhizobium sp. BG8]QRM55310.1 hypothetical protein F3Y30_12780 [Sinorhizobium sp. BG8]
MTEKIAIFTEGKTEQSFICKLIEHFAGNRAYHVTKSSAYGGRKTDFIEIRLQHEGVAENEPHDFYFLVMNCGGEERVISMINDRIDGLIKNGYTHLIGVRDLRPNFTYDDYDRLREGSVKHFENKALKPLIVIARMEVEAWFIAENKHFIAIDEALTVEKILQDVGVNIAGDSEIIETPATELHRIYGIVGKEYGKTGGDIQRTVDALDFSEFKGSAGERAPTVVPLIDRVEEIFQG